MRFVVEAVNIPELSRNGIQITDVDPSVQRCRRPEPVHIPVHLVGPAASQGADGMEEVSGAHGGALHLKRDSTLYCRSLTSLSKCPPSTWLKTRLLFEVIVEFGFVVIFFICRSTKQNTSCLSRFAEHAPVVSVQDLRPRAKNDPPGGQLCPVQRGAPPQRRQQGPPHLPFPAHLLDRLLCKWSAF